MLLLLLLAACSHAGAPAPESTLVADHAPRTLYDLGGLELLQSRFNRDAGKARLVLLLSPT